MDIILSGPRRSWSRAEKLAIAAETLADGVRVVDVQRRYRVSSGQLHTWRKQFRDELGFPAAPTAASAPSPAQGVSPLQFMSLAIATQALPTTIDIAIGGATMKISGAVDAAVMAALVTALRGKSK